MHHKHSITILIFTLLFLFIGSCLINIYFCMNLNQKISGLQENIRRFSVQTHNTIQELTSHLPEDAPKFDEQEMRQQTMTAITRNFAPFYRYLRYIVWVMGLLGIIGFILACRIFYLLESHLTKPLHRIKKALKDALAEDLPSRRIPRQSSPMLNEIADLCNQMFIHWQHRQDEHFLKVNMLQKTALQLIELPQKPTLVITSGNELLLSNAMARDYLLGDAGERFLQYLLTAASQGDQEFDSHGRRFKLTRIDPNQIQAKYCVVNIYQFEPQGIIQEEGPKL